MPPILYSSSKVEANTVTELYERGKFKTIPARTNQNSFNLYRRGFLTINSIQSCVETGQIRSNIMAVHITSITAGLYSRIFWINVSSAWAKMSSNWVDYFVQCISIFNNNNTYLYSSFRWSNSKRIEISNYKK